MNFLSEEQAAWKQAVERWLERDVGREYIRKCDMERAFPYEAYAKAAKLGFHRLLVPEADGGDGGDLFSYALMCEALSRYGVDFSVAVAGSTFTAMNIALHGTPEQKKRFLDPFMRGEVRFPISMSEPGAGSDVANVQTRAERVGDEYVINGQKLWCSGAANRGAVILMLVRTAKTEDKRNGLSVFIIPERPSYAAAGARRARARSARRLGFGPRGNRAAGRAGARLRAHGGLISQGFYQHGGSR